MVVMAVLLVGFLPQISEGLAVADIAITSKIASMGVQTSRDIKPEVAFKNAKDGPPGKSSSGFTGISSGVSASLKNNGYGSFFLGLGPPSIAFD